MHYVKMPKQPWNESWRLNAASHSHHFHVRTITKLYNYIFEWGDHYTGAAVALGYVSIYNHSHKANCIYEMDFENEQIVIITTRDIAIGEELFINYNADNDSDKPVWFDAI